VSNVDNKDFGFLVHDDPKTALVLAVRVAIPNYQSVQPQKFEELLAKEFQIAERAK
jgi:hypothetical protein